MLYLLACCCLLFVVWCVVCVGVYMVRVVCCLMVVGSCVWSYVRCVLRVS